MSRHKSYKIETFGLKLNHTLQITIFVNMIMSNFLKYLYFLKLLAEVQIYNFATHITVIILSTVNFVSTFNFQLDTYFSFQSSIIFNVFKLKKSMFPI